MSRSRLGRLLLLSALVATETGCSFAFVKGPPPHIEPPAKPYVRGHDPCTRLNIVPALDIAAGAFSVGMVVIAAIGTPPPDQTPEQRRDAEHTANVVALVGLPLAALAAASAIYGFYQTSKCQEYAVWAQLVAPPSGPVASPPASGTSPPH